MGNTTLVIMAAGIGSRFGGGIKQLTSFGPNGEIIMDYSIYDAIEAGFNKVVFVIRKDLEQEFKSIIGNRIESRVKVGYAFQELRDIPEGCVFPEGRTKPWGTGQAVLCCRDLIQEPFAVINADDYYGKNAFRLMHDYLNRIDDKNGASLRVGMAGFILKNTLSEHGGVTRGLCSVNSREELLGISETKNIVRTDYGAAVQNPDGSLSPIDENCPVSMNFWGFTPEIFNVLGEGFKDFINGLDEDSLLTGEYLLPDVVDDLLRAKKTSVSVLKTDDQWFGVTYKEDVPLVIEKIRESIERGEYPFRLWN